MDKTKLIVVAGPTASGKTALAVRIAAAVNGEVISADSMQVYKGMGIATAAPTAEEMQGVPHHLVECVGRETPFSVSDFRKAAQEIIKEIAARGKTPVIAGGTGLFIDSLVDNVNFIETENDDRLRERLMAKSADELYGALSAIDPQSAEKIHKNNKKRVARALEIYYLTGKTKSEADREALKQGSPYETLYFVIEFKNREQLYERINRRVDSMLEHGLVNEAKACLASGGKTAAQAIGHKELLPYFCGAQMLEQAVLNIKKETRRYAKRQITWFKRRSSAVRLYADDIGEHDIAAEAVRISRDFIYGKRETGENEKKA
ncbi:MAG TPA: tRNA (adenosine(37)-N6)-dimethylallyltransferase MiaA [Candidatus Eubacterium faecavium]|nr:tRNA (adenosine(37)-N6)-dimethylallyltransferase MiaA [Candidatus Eubacterium faecavium]